MTKQRHKQTHSLNIHQQSKDGCCIVVEISWDFCCLKSPNVYLHTHHTRNHISNSLLLIIKIRIFLIFHLVFPHCGAVDGEMVHDKG